MITVLTWLWTQQKSRTNYTAHHVNLWAAMVRRNLSMSHRIACVTDTPRGIDPSVEIIPPTGEFVGMETPTWRNAKPNCFRRLVMFRRDAAKTFGKRFVSMDLDCVIGGPLDPLFDRKEDLVLFKGTSPNRHYNGSMQLITAGCRPHVYEKFNLTGAEEAGIRFHGSDQAWLCYHLGPGEATWGEGDGVCWFNPGYPGSWKPKPKPKPTILFFPGRTKPWDWTMLPFVKNNYRLDMREAA